MTGKESRLSKALYGLLAALALLPAALAYVAICAGLWRFIAWCLGV